MLDYAKGGRPARDRLHKLPEAEPDPNPSLA